MWHIGCSTVLKNGNISALNHVNFRRTVFRMLPLILRVYGVCYCATINVLVVVISCVYALTLLIYCRAQCPTCNAVRAFRLAHTRVLFYLPVRYTSVRARFLCNHALAQLYAHARFYGRIQPVLQNCTIALGNENPVSIVSLLVLPP